ncbi:hypothetical protein CA11_03710 [Gimesia maris]|nr:hypothetical protein [Gimesia maris]QDU12592.1 hypothetical protein CA11_03710 [Gimesia maris]
MWPGAQTRRKDLAHLEVADYDGYMIDYKSLDGIINQLQQIKVPDR